MTFRSHVYNYDVHAMSTLDYRDFAAMAETYLLFGRYPTQREVEYLESIGVTMFVDVTAENLSAYAVKPATVIKYPIIDRRTPSNIKTFDQLIQRLLDAINSGEVIYVHCRRGHGRSALVAACLYARMHDVGSDVAIAAIRAAHQARKVMDARWRKLGAPQTKAQHNFIKHYVKSVHSENAVEQSLLST